MRIEQLALEVAFPELCFGKLDGGQHGAETRARNDRHHLVWYVVTIRFRHHRELFKDVVYKLRCDDDFHFAALYRLWAGIYELTRAATFLVFCCCRCKQEVLRISTACRGLQKGRQRGARMAIWALHHDSKTTTHPPLCHPRIQPP
jgi:hypothetical protein